MISIDFDRVHRLATVKDLIEPIRRAFLTVEYTPARGHYELVSDSGPGTLLIMPAWRSPDAIGVKITTVFPDNPAHGHPSIAGSYLLLSWSTGEPRALIDGRALTLMRTAAVSAMAADLLAPPDPEVLLMVGTGALSRYLIEGHHAVRGYKSILVWGRNPSRAEGVATQLRERGFPIAVHTDLESAARSAAVICCATASEATLIKGAWLRSDTYLDLIGSFKPAMRETDDECFRRALVVVDTLDAASESGDLIGPIASGMIDKSQITLLRTVVQKGAGSRNHFNTVFKSVGVASADLAVAEWLVSTSSRIM
jgi:ornithine cyclodeaminase